jgi:heme exporter protein A
MDLHADNLTCERGGRIVFKGIAFAVGGGEFLQITGPNGSGKSSLLRLIAGLNEATEGKLTLKGGHEELSIGQQCHLIAHQEAVKTALTVAENLDFWRDFLGGGDSAKALASLGLARLALYPAGLLSAGQKRRLALARLALIPRAIWLLDEPTVGLDSASQERLTGLMQDHLKRGGVILAATHIPLGLKPHQKLELGGDV